MKYYTSRFESSHFTIWSTQHQFTRDESMATRIVWWTKMNYFLILVYKRELLFISSSPFRIDSSQPIQLQYFWWIYSEQVVAELIRVIYGRNQQAIVESFGAVDSIRCSYSTRVAEHCDSKQWLDLLQHCPLPLHAHLSLDSLNLKS
jgi:hypothetical protein